MKSHLRTTTQGFKTLLDAITNYFSDQGHEMSKESGLLCLTKCRHKTYVKSGYEHLKEKISARKEMR